MLGGRTIATIINNAAIQILGRVEDLTQEDFSKSMDVNVTAPFLLTKLCLCLMEAGNSSIINIGSIHAHNTKPEFVAYATSKAALDGLTRALAVELGEKSQG